MLKNKFLFIGSVGFTIVLLLNLFGGVYLEQAAAVPFQTSWYSTWLPSYIVWFVFLSIGLAKFNKSGVSQART